MSNFQESRETRSTKKDEVQWDRVQRKKKRARWGLTRNPGGRLEDGEGRISGAGNAGTLIPARNSKKDKVWFESSENWNN